MKETLSNNIPQIPFLFIYNLYFSIIISTRGNILPKYSHNRKHLYSLLSYCNHMKTIKLYPHQIKEIDEIKGDSPRNRIVERGIVALNRKDDIIKEIEFLKKNTYYPKIEEPRVAKAWARVFSLVHGI